MRVRDDLRHVEGAGKCCSFGFTTYIHFNPSFPGETYKHLLLVLCTAYPLTYCPLIYFTLNRHDCAKEHSLKLVQFFGGKNKSGFFSNNKINIRILHCSINPKIVTIFSLCADLLLKRKLGMGTQNQEGGHNEKTSYSFVVNSD